MRTALAIIIGCAAVLEGGCPRAPAPQSQARPAAALADQLIAMGTYGIESDAARVYVVWNDDLCAAFLNDREQGPRILFGQATPGTFARAVAAIDAIPDIWQLKQHSHSVPHSNLAYVGVREAQRNILLAWDETISPCWGANVDAGEDYKAFAVAFVRAKIEIASAFSCTTEASVGDRLPEPLRQRTGVDTVAEAIKSRWLRRAVTGKE